MATSAGAKRRVRLLCHVDAFGCVSVDIWEVAERDFFVTPWCNYSH